MAASGRRLCESICLYFVSDEDINRAAQNRAGGPDFNDLPLLRKINILAKIGLLSNLLKTKNKFPKEHMHVLRKHGNEAAHAQKQKGDQKENDSNEEQQEDPGKK
eukprot:310369_1